MFKHLEAIYGKEVANGLSTRIEQLIAKRNVPSSNRLERFSESDLILITYGDQFDGKLSSLNKWTNKKLSKSISAIHLLPFYPYSSDGGFSVIDYREVDPDMGKWKDVEGFSKDLMFDAVFNHISAKSGWFKEWLESGNKDDYFIHYSPEKAEEIRDELAKVTRPRALPLLSKFETTKGERMVWTTFSDDQIDLNFESTDLLLELVDILLMYAQKGAKYIRIDAVPFFWKEVGTSCAHHSKTHELVKFFRSVLDKAGSDCLIITESNVPHLDNISYFGEGNDEAHMVYNFSLAPLILHASLSGSAKHIHEWSKNLADLPKDCTFFNFTGTHDGIGLRPLEGILSTEETAWLCKETVKRGGGVNYKRNPDGSESPYEATVTWTSALFDESISEKKWGRRVVSSHLAMCSFPGVPGMYVHNFMATQNWNEGLEATGHNRDINRRKFSTSEAKEILKKPFEKDVFDRLTTGLEIRRDEKAFHPKGEMIDLNIDEKVWSFVRVSPDGKEKILVLYNLDFKAVDLKIDNPSFSGKCVDLLSEQREEIPTHQGYSLCGCGIAWLKIL